MRARILVTSVIGGAMITLLTSLVPSTPEMLVGATWYGLPIAWLFRLVIAPEYFPWRVSFMPLIVDVVFWAVIVGLILFVLKKLMEPASGSS